MNAYEQQASDALRAFHKVAAAEFPDAMQMPWDEFIAWIQTAGPNALTDLGKSVAAAASLSGVGMQGVINSMESLARQAQGGVSRYPDGYPRLQMFYDALVGRALQWDVSVVATVSKDIAVEGAQKVATAATVGLAGYGLVLALSAAAGIFVVISSWRKRA